VGRSDRRDRHRDRSSASSPDRYVHIAAQRLGRRSRVPNERTQHRAWHSELARPPLRRGQVRHHTEAGEQFSWAIPHIESELGAMPLS